MNLEEYIFLNSNNIQADDTYISDGVFAIRKDRINNKIISSYKNNSNNILEAVSIEVGKNFDIEIGTELTLLRHRTLGIKYNDNFYFDYDIIKMILNYFTFDFLYTTVVENGCTLYGKQYPVLKFFDEDEEFIGCLMPLGEKNFVS